MQKNKWNRKLDWIKSDNVYIQDNRIEKYDENKVIAVGDIYFRLNKYLTGVTFTYINNLENIYKIDLLTGDGYSIYNMYNEYDIIDRVMKNFIIVDVASNDNIDIKKQLKYIDGVKLNPNHLVLLKNQKSEFENDIYIVNNKNFLENAGILSSREKSEKFSCSVKLGTNADKQFFLNNNGFEFPINFEPKYFIEGKSYILKNLIGYNIYNTSTGNTSKIIFTDIGLAKNQTRENADLYYPIEIVSLPAMSSPNVFLEINYHHNNPYIIRNTDSGFTFSGLTLDISNVGGFTAIQFPISFDCKNGDYLNLSMFSGSTLVLSCYVWIKDINNDYIILEEVIPNYILTELKNTIFYIDNLNIATDWYNSIDKANLSPYNEFCSFSGYTYISYGIDYLDINITPIESVYNKYFDYNGLIIDGDDNNQSGYFITDNLYLKYNLYERLNEINSGFTSGFTMFNNYILSGNTINRFKYTDDGRIKIITTIDNIKNIFKPFTYVYVSGFGENTEKTLVYEVNDYEIIVEKPKRWTKYPTQAQKPILLSIQNIDGLKNISDILYEVYQNQDYDWYISKSDNERRYIYKSYGELLTTQKFFRDNVTGILYENDNNEYILKLYDLENDPNLYFETNELIFIGSDKKSRLPVPLKKYDFQTYTSSIISGATQKNIEFFDVIDGGQDNLPIYYFDSGLNCVLPPPSDIAINFNVLNSNL